MRKTRKGSSSVRIGGTRVENRLPRRKRKIDRLKYHRWKPSAAILNRIRTARVEVSLRRKEIRWLREGSMRLVLIFSLRSMSRRERSYWPSNKIINDSITDLKTKHILRDYVHTLVSNSLNKTNESIKFCWMGSDVFYLPKEFLFEFNLLAKLYRQKNVFLEFAVPTILSGLNENFKWADILQGKYYWTTYYDFNDYSKTFHFAHPMKLSHYLNMDLRKKMCTSYLQERVNEY